MYLSKLYSEPEGLFPKVEFTTGINFIFGKKSSSNDPKKSLNSIGKSTFLDLIDFALLASFQRRHNPRLYKAKDIMSGYKVVLEFEINGKKYIIKRGVDKHKEIEFFDGSKKHLYSVNELSPILCDLVFMRDDYEGYYSQQWLRRLISFYMKIQKHKKGSFSDPISYLKHSTIAELNQYHLFLLNMNNNLAHENFKIQEELKKTKPMINKIKEFIEETKNIQDISEAMGEMNKLSTEISDLEDSIKTFKLAKQYENIEGKSNKLTSSIKEFWYQNYCDRKKIALYEKSCEFKNGINSLRVKKIYEEFNEILAEKIKYSLDEAVEFRKRLAQSRENFLKGEITQLNKAIVDRKEKIKQLERERSKLFKFLEAKKAIQDLTEAFFLLTEKRSKLDNIKGQVDMYNKWVQEKAEREVEEKKIESQLIRYLGKIKEKRAQFHKIFTEIYNAIYPKDKEGVLFSIVPAPSTTSKLEFKISFAGMYGKGKNQGRTLIYDLAVLFNAINNNIHGPRFLIHDGIFDGVDKAHFVSLYEFLEAKKLQGIKFQYLVTLNEEGTLTEKFGNADKVNPNKIEKEAIIVLSPK